MKLLYAARSSKPKWTLLPSCNNVDFTFSSSPLECLFSLYLPYTETYPLCLFNMLCFLSNIYSIQSVVIFYLRSHNYFRCIFHTGALTLWLSSIYYVLTYLPFPNVFFLLFYYFVFYLVNYNPSNRPPYLFAPPSF